MQGVQLSDSMVTVYGVDCLHQEQMSHFITKQTRNHKVVHLSYCVHIIDIEMCCETILYFVISLCIVLMHACIIIVSPFQN